MATPDTSEKPGIVRGGKALILCLLTGMLTGCSGALNWQDGSQAKSVSSVSRSPSGVTARHKAADVAVGMLGKPYLYGGAGPGSFDCSGLVQYSYSAVGLQAPRTSRAQYDAARPIRLTDAEPGDLLFFRYDRRISHVAIYLGDERFVHAPSSGKHVSVASLRDPHYQQHFVSVGRLP